ncbi:MAG: C69 family dipeptidase [Candidatus Krumholzibacteriia bacterium]
MIALADATPHRRVVFGKNSDRPAGECQVLYDSIGEKRTAAGVVQCAFVEVPEGPTPLRTIGCRPYWCWGYETGMNEAGVVGGNTAVYTRSFWQAENQQQYGLTGMELLRLGLERGSTADDVVAVIADLLGRYGQWAPAVLGKEPPEGCYENAFLIADKEEAWILETAGRRWAARRLTSGAHALSNQLTIRNQWTTGSDDLLGYAQSQAWWSVADGPLDFALAYSDHEHYARQVSHIRWSRASQLLAGSSGRIDADGMMACLRDHYEGTFLQGPQFSEYLPDFLTLCMHDSPAAFTWGNTATSVVVEIDPDSPAASPFWCCYQPPCAGVYLAYTIEGGLPAPVSMAGTAGLRSESPLTAPKDAFQGGSLWWRMYRIVEAISRSPVKRRETARPLFDPIERKYFERVRSLRSEAVTDRSAQMRRCTEEQLSEVEAVLDRLEREWGLEGN